MKSIIGLSVLMIVVSACSLTGNPNDSDRFPSHHKEITTTGGSQAKQRPVRKNRFGMEFVYINPGVFTMGSPRDEKPRSEFEIQHQVTLSRGFYIGKTEVTIGQFRKFVDATGYQTDAEKNEGEYSGCAAILKADGKLWWTRNASTHWRSTGFEQSDNMPVTCVSWNDTQAYIGWLSDVTGQTYRLPTEAEWEYAARSGSQSARFWGDTPDEACAYSNVGDRDGRDINMGYPLHECSDGYLHSAPVGSFKPNGFGLNDMIGNVWEWCQDYFGPYPSGAVTDPKGSSEEDANRHSSRPGPYHLARGCSWSEPPHMCRAAARRIVLAKHRRFDTGFRLVLGE